jgi:hypothetical protein
MYANHNCNHNPSLEVRRIRIENGQPILLTRRRESEGWRWTETTLLIGTCTFLFSFADVVTWVSVRLELQFQANHYLESRIPLALRHSQVRIECEKGYLIIANYHVILLYTRTLSSVLFGYKSRWRVPSFSSRTRSRRRDQI